MKNLCFSLLSIFLAASVAHAEYYWEPSSQPPQFCVQNFNAYGPIYARNVQERTAHMVSALKFAPKCEIVHLQEVWNEGQINQLEYSLSSVFNISTPNRASRIGLMSLTMGELKSEETYAFRINSDGSILDKGRELFKVTKAFHVVRTKLFGIDEEFYLINTHLHPSSSEVRIQQLLEILEWRKSHMDLKVIMTGDFNAGIESPERHLIMEVMGFQDAMEEVLGGYPKEYCTYCKANPTGWLNEDRVFDYIFYSNAGQAPTILKPVRGEVNMKGGARKPWSDHYGVRVHFFLM